MMDKQPPLLPLNVDAFEMTTDKITPITSSEGEYTQSPLSSSTSLMSQAFYYDAGMAENMYNQQHFDIQFQHTQNLFPIEASHIWSSSAPPQHYLPAPAPSSSLPDRHIDINISPSTSSAIRHDYVPLAKRPSISGSVRTNPSDTEESVTHNEAGERRRERRRAQNRAAQRAFRARKEETIKQSSTRLDALQEELTRLQLNNDGLSETVATLRAQIQQLQRENNQLKRLSSNSAGAVDWETFDLNALDSEITSNASSHQHIQSQGQTEPHPLSVPPPLKSEYSHDSGVYGMSASASARSSVSTSSRATRTRGRGPAVDEEQAAIATAAAVVSAGEGNDHNTLLSIEEDR